MPQFVASRLPRRRDYKIPAESARLETGATGLAWAGIMECAASCRMASWTYQCLWRAGMTAEMDWGECIARSMSRTFPRCRTSTPRCSMAWRGRSGSAAGFSRISRAESVGIRVSEAYRARGVGRYLPALVEELHRAGARDADIRFVFASGTHRVPTPDQQRTILGPAIFDRFRGRLFTREAYNDSRHVRVGITSRGTPVELDRLAMECDRIIATGAVVLHYFGGFGGGRKSIVPGLASARTIAAHAINCTTENHSPDVRIGVGRQSVAEDMLEAAKLAQVPALSTPCSTGRANRGTVRWRTRTGARAAAELARSLYAVPISRKADMVIVRGLREELRPVAQDAL